MEHETVSIIIPSFGNASPRALDGLKAQSLAWHDAVVVTNVSPAARARNLGAKTVHGKYLIFLDDDVRFNDPNFLEEVINSLKSLGPRDAVSITWHLSTDANWVQRTLFGDPLYTFDRQVRITELSWRECGAACFAIGSKCFADLGGFDEGLVSGEDCELAYRVVRSGGKILTLPHRSIPHDPPGTIGQTIKKAFWYERGNAQVARKFPEAGYRIGLNSPFKAIGYLLLRSVLLIPLMFLKVNYRQRWPRWDFRPLQALISYMGAWAYVREWLFPSKLGSMGGTDSLIYVANEKVMSR